MIIVFKMNNSLKSNQGVRVISFGRGIIVKNYEVKMQEQKKLFEKGNSFNQSSSYAYKHCKPKTS